MNAVTMQSLAASGGADGGGAAAVVAASQRTQLLFFSTWLLYYVLRLMVRYVSENDFSFNSSLYPPSSHPFFRFLLSGFELELYSTHEYSYFYWYLYELLFPWITTCLHRADTYLVEHEQMMESQQKQTGKTHFQEKCTKLF